jgi:hypothetical protein
MPELESDSDSDSDFDDEMYKFDKLERLRTF